MKSIKEYKTVTNELEETKDELKKIESFTVEGFTSLSKNQEMIYGKIDEMNESINIFLFDLYNRSKKQMKTLNILYIISLVSLIISTNDSSSLVKCDICSLVMSPSTISKTD